MADDRAVEDPTTAVARLQRELDDLRSTLLARVGIRATGDVEPTIRTTPKPNTLIMQGQVVQRAAYPGLWQWVQENALLKVGLFGPGDGSTTFGLPDFRGRVLRGVAASGEVPGALIGTDSLVLAIANLPAHTHTINAVNDHIHPRNSGNRFTNETGWHDGHNDRTGTSMAGSPPNPTVAYGIAQGGVHNHTVDPGDPSGGHSHTATNTGSGTAIDTRQASVAVNWLIWT